MTHILRKAEGCTELLQIRSELERCAGKETEKSKGLKQEVSTIRKSMNGGQRKRG